MTFKSSILKRAALSQQAVSYLKRFLQGKGDNPSTNVAVEIGKYRPEKPYPALFRVVGFWPKSGGRGARLPQGIWVKGNRVSMDATYPTSWTIEESIAKQYAVSNHQYWAIVRLDNHPVDFVLCDTNILPIDERAQLINQDNKEVILRPSSMRPVVHDLGKGKQGGYAATSQWGL